MIQDLFPDRLENHFTDRKPEPDSPVLAFSEGKLFCRYLEAEREIRFPEYRELDPGTDTVYLFSIGQKRYFLACGAAAAPAGYAPAGLKEVRLWPVSGNEAVFAAFTGFHVWSWMKDSRFCGRCGTETVRDTEERAMVCPACGRKIYPRINPAVIIGVTNGNSLLITRYRTGYGSNALVAGFTEIGETLEETVAREVMEEAGLKVKNIRYYKSQPWGIAADLLAGFYCDVDGDDTIRMDEGELKYAEWVERDRIVLQPTDYSLTNEMMRMFRDGAVR